MSILEQEEYFGARRSISAFTLLQGKKLSMTKSDRAHYRGIFPTSDVMTQKNNILFGCLSDLLRYTVSQCLPPIWSPLLVCKTICK